MYATIDKKLRTFEIISFEVIGLPDVSFLVTFFKKPVYVPPIRLGRGVFCLSNFFSSSVVLKCIFVCVGILT